MATDKTTEIAAVEAVTATGLASITHDGTSQTFDRAALRKELRELRQQDTTHTDRRPFISRIDLSGF